MFARCCHGRLLGQAVCHRHDHSDAFGLLVLIPSWNTPTVSPRAIIPGLDIDRISRTRISIERPQPASTVVPANETSAIVVSLHGQAADRATLQWYDAEGNRGKVEMQANEVSDVTAPAVVASFAANLAIGPNAVHYRIQAGDGVTAWHVLEPRADQRSRYWKR